MSLVERPHMTRRIGRKRRFCVVCGNEIIGRNYKMCSEQCQRIHYQTYNNRYEQTHDRSAYYRAYYAENKAKKNSRAADRWRRKREENDPVWAAHQRARDRRQRQVHWLTRKVAREWGVDHTVARAWIEQGSFPP